MLCKDEVQKLIDDFSNLKVKMLSEISLINFLNFCKFKLANKGRQLVYRDKLLMHQLYSNKLKETISGIYRLFKLNKKICTVGDLLKFSGDNLKTMWKKKFTSKELKEALEIFQVWSLNFSLYVRNSIISMIFCIS